MTIVLFLCESAYFEVAYYFDVTIFYFLVSIACTLQRLLGWHISLIAIGIFILVPGIVIIIIIFIVVVRPNSEFSVILVHHLICDPMEFILSRM